MFIGIVLTEVTTTGPPAFAPVPRLLIVPDSTTHVTRALSFISCSNNSSKHKSQNTPFSSSLLEFLSSLNNLSSLLYKSIKSFLILFLESLKLSLIWSNKDLLSLS